MHDRSFTVSLYLQLSPLIWFSVSEVVMRRIARYAVIPSFLLTVAAPIVSVQELPSTDPGMVENIVTETPVSGRRAFNYLGIATDI